MTKRLANPNSIPDEDPLRLVPSDLMHLLPGFLERREKEVMELMHFLDRRDFESIRVLGHRMKGHGEGYGFPIITEIGRKLEEAALGARTEQIATQIGELSTFTQTLNGLLRLKFNAA